MTIHTLAMTILDDRNPETHGNLDVRRDEVYGNRNNGGGPGLLNIMSMMESINNEVLNNDHNHKRWNFKYDRIGSTYIIKTKIL